MATAAFLGGGGPPAAPHGGGLVGPNPKGRVHNRTGLFLQPWAVVVPALLIAALSTGTNLLFGAALHTPAKAAREGDRR
ncbi:hypothetical protein ACFV9E_17790 [Streptomyces sp. NPDC059835]|uniref:hypothetical protein n=1 Tax=Streptomyces sp. NPDC059835 TaxID=3346967 RepID=UPI0036551B07